jgi:hypothetical protein
VNAGDIHWVDLPTANGREQRGRRPAVILQDDDYAGDPACGSGCAADHSKSDDAFCWNDAYPSHGCKRVAPDIGGAGIPIAGH